MEIEAENLGMLVNAHQVPVFGNLRPNCAQYSDSANLRRNLIKNPTSETGVVKHLSVSRVKRAS